MLQSISFSQNIATLTWSSVTGYSYRLQYCQDLAAGTWSNLGPDVMATNSLAGATNDVGTSTQRFYRVILLP